MTLSIGLEGTDYGAKQVYVPAVAGALSLRSSDTLSPLEGKPCASSTPFSRSSPEPSSVSLCRSEGR